jgi:hypothetical protein
MSLHDLLALVVAAALIVLAAAVHSPFAESLSRQAVRIASAPREQTGGVMLSWRKARAVDNSEFVSPLPRSPSSASASGWQGLFGLSLLVSLACSSRLCGGGVSLPGCRGLASRRPPLPRLRCLLTGCELLCCCHRRLPSYGAGSVPAPTGQTNPSDRVMNRPASPAGHCQRGFR